MSGTHHLSHANLLMGGNTGLSSIAEVVSNRQSQRHLDSGPRKSHLYKVPS